MLEYFRSSLNIIMYMQLIVTGMESSHDASKYTAVAMGKDFVWFIDNVIGEPAVVSGHSSGGILAKHGLLLMHEVVQGIVLEDPPFLVWSRMKCRKHLSGLIVLNSSITLESNH